MNLTQFFDALIKLQKYGYKIYSIEEDDLNELKELLLGINELWDSSGEEMRECYFSSVIGKLWCIL